MSKDTKAIKDTFHSKLEKATLKELQEAITWRLGDIQKSTETIVESVGNCNDTVCHKDALRSVAYDLRDVLSKIQTIQQYLDMIQKASVYIYNILNMSPNHPTC